MTGFAINRCPTWVRTLALSGLAMAAVVLSPSTTGATGTGVARNEAVQKGNLFSLELYPTNIVVGEPVYLRLRIQNTSGTLAVGNFSARFHLSEGNDIEVRVQEPGQLPRRYAGPEEPGLYAGSEHNLDRNQSVEQDFLLFYEPKNPKGLLFDTPGDYMISARVQGSVYREKSVEAIVLPPTKVTVRPLEGPDAARTLDAVGQKDFAKALHTAVNMEPAMIARMKAFVRSHPNSPWTPLALSVIGNDLLYGAKPNLPAAARLFSDVAARFPNSPRAPAALFSAATAFQRNNDRDSARAMYWLLKDLYPNYPLLRKETPLAGEFEYGPKDAQATRPWFHYAKPYDLVIKEKNVEAKVEGN